MKTTQVINIIEKFAPLNLQESWDNSGFQIFIEDKEVTKIMLCLSPTENIVNQALENHCELIIAHHPLFIIPLTLNKGINIYSAHTNLDKAEGGTTDTLINKLGLKNKFNHGEFLRLVELNEEADLDKFLNTLKTTLNLNTLRVVNNHKKQKIKKLAFCAGSGADFIKDAEAIGADILITGDVKYHSALDSDIMILDIGHFESEYPVLDTLKNLLKITGIEVLTADEKSPFTNF